MINQGIRIAVALVMLAMPTVPLAQTSGVQLSGFQADPNAPVEVNADSLDVTQALGTAVFTGNVVVTQGLMTMTSEALEIAYERLPDGSLGETVETITASGGVTLVTPDEAAEAETAVYTPGKNEVVMTGEVLLTQGPNTLAGESLVIDIETGTGKVEGRVRTILQTGGSSQ